MLTKTREAQVDSAAGEVRQMTMIQALRSAMDVMMERDDNVVVFGQDVSHDIRYLRAGQEFEL